LISKKKKSCKEHRFYLEWFFHVLLIVFIFGLENSFKDGYVESIYSKGTMRTGIFDVLII